MSRAACAWRKRDCRATSRANSGSDVPCILDNDTCGTDSHAMVTTSRSQTVFPRISLWLPLFVVHLALMLWCAAAHAQAKDLAWHVFEPSGGRFVTKMPGEPLYERKVEHTIIGSIVTRRYIWRKYGMTFAAAYADIPSIAAMFASRHRVYSKVEQAYLERARVTEIARAEFTQDAYRGSELTFADEEVYGKLRILKVSRLGACTSWSRRCPGTAPTSRSSMSTCHSSNPSIARHASCIDGYPIYLMIPACCR